MARAQCVLVIALSIGLVHSWDFVVSAGDRMEFYTNDGNQIATLRFNSQNLTALVYDEVHNMLLYVSKESDNDAICGYNMTSVENKCYVQRNGRNIQGLAFDPITELLFFTDTKERSINSLSFKSGFINNIFGNLIIKMDEAIPTDIAVDHCRGYIYWINTNLMTSTIERARFNGSDREVVISATHKLDLHSLAIDQQTNTIYWVEPETHLKCRIHKADLNGKNSTSFLESTTSNGGILFWRHPNVLSVSKNNLFYVNWCSNCGPQNVWKYQTPEIQTANHVPLIRVNFKGAVGIAANYKMKDQFQGLSDCNHLPDNYETGGVLNVAREYYVGTYCVHGTKFDGQSVCKCKSGYTGLRCEVSSCENYCLQGNCSLTQEGLPECRCDPGYFGTRCEINVCVQYCLNNGTCSLNEADEPVCDCVGEYEGERCDTPVSVNNGDCSPRKEHEPACQCDGSHEDSSQKADENKTTTTSSPYYLVEKNITLADLLENWSKRAQRFP